MTTDLFADEETTYYDDVDQFLTLQNGEIDALAEEKRKTAAGSRFFTCIRYPGGSFERPAKMSRPEW